MHDVDQARDGVGRCVGPDAVAEVEDVRAAATGVEHGVRLPFQRRRVRVEDRRVQIALQRARTESGACRAQVGSPIDADDFAGKSASRILR